MAMKYVNDASGESGTLACVSDERTNLYQKTFLTSGSIIFNAPIGPS